jgi:hypothetical protein
LIEPVELLTSLVAELRIGGEGPEQAGGQWRVDALEEFEKQDAKAIARRQQSIASGVRDPFDQAVTAEYSVYSGLLRGLPSPEVYRAFSNCRENIGLRRPSS